MSMTFIDTSFLLALASPRDALHTRAVMWRYASAGPFITTEFCLLEVGDALASRDLRHLTLSIFENLRRSKSTEVVKISSSLFERGYARYIVHKDKDWGLSDCISFELMSERGIVDALTHDRHFEQAGFRALLRHEPSEN